MKVYGSQVDTKGLKEEIKNISDKLHWKNAKKKLKIFLTLNLASVLVNPKKKMWNFQKMKKNKNKSIF